MKKTSLSVIGMVLAFAAVAQYCTPPDYLSGPFTNITGVTLLTLSNTTGTADGYQDFTTGQNVPDLQAGSAQPMSLTFSYDLPGQGFTDNLNIRVWIDFNQDQDFTDPGEEVVSAVVDCSSGTGQWSGNITIPSGATTGNTRMRIYEDMTEADGHITPEPCGYLNYPSNPLGQHGNAEDYTVNITSPTGILANDNHGLSVTNTNQGIVVRLQEGKGAQLSVYSLLGALCADINIPVNEGHLYFLPEDLLLPGNIYLFKLSTGDEVITQKLLIH